jgi:hypothetical protein
MPELSWAPIHQVLGYGPDMFGYALPLAGDARMSSRPNHAHNSIFHTAVELGALGLVAYGLLLAALVVTGARLVARVMAGSLPLSAGFIVAGLVASLVGRFVEQLAGKPQVADLALTWALVGMVAAIAGWTAEQWGPQFAASSTRAKPGGRQAAMPRRTMVVGGLRLPHAAIAAVVCVVVLVVWWQIVVGPLVQSNLVARAASASEAGQPVQPGNLLESAVLSDPTAAIPRLLLGRGLLLGSRSEPTLVARVAGLQAALRVVQGTFDRNPMDYRAWVAAGKMAQELAALDPVTFGSQAIAIAERSAALLPGYRDPQEQLALTLLVAGEYQRAIEMADMARGLATRTDLDGVYLNYITAKALLRLGRADEAGALINAIAASEYADAAVLKQDLRQVE